MAQFAAHIKSFPFYEECVSKLSSAPKNDDTFVYDFVKAMLGEDGLNYGFPPKRIVAVSSIW